MVKKRGEHLKVVVRRGKVKSGVAVDVAQVGLSASSVFQQQRHHLGVPDCAATKGRMNVSACVSVRVVSKTRVHTGASQM